MSDLSDDELPALHRGLIYGDMEAIGEAMRLIREARQENERLIARNARPVAERDRALMNASWSGGYNEGERRGYERCTADVVAWLRPQQLGWGLATRLCGQINAGEHVGAATPEPAEPTGNPGGHRSSQNLDVPAGEAPTPPSEPPVVDEADCQGEGTECYVHNGACDPHPFQALDHVIGCGRCGRFRLDPIHAAGEAPTPPSSGIWE